MADDDELDPLIGQQGISDLENQLAIAGNQLVHGNSSGQGPSGSGGGSGLPLQIRPNARLQIRPNVPRNRNAWMAADLNNLEEHLADEQPLFPLDKNSMVALLKPSSAAAFAIISTLNTISATLVAPKAKGFLQAFLYNTPITFIPFGLLGIVFAVNATENRRMMGLAYGYMLGELLYIILLGAVNTVLMSNAELLPVAFVTACMTAAVVFGWSWMFTYPQCLQCCMFGRPKKQKLTAKEAAKEAKDAHASALKFSRTAAVFAGKAVWIEREAAREASQAKRAARLAEATGEGATAALRSSRQADEMVSLATRAAKSAQDSRTEARRLKAVAKIALDDTIAALDDTIAAMKETQVLKDKVASLGGSSSSSVVL